MSGVAYTGPYSSPSWLLNRGDNKRRTLFRMAKGWPQPLYRDPGGMLGLIFAGYVQLASQSPYPVIVYSVAYNYYRPHLSHFWANMSFSRSQLRKV